MKASSSAIEDVIKENNQYLNAELKVAKEAVEGINALKTFAEIETPSLEAAIKTLANTLETIEKAREEKVNQLKEKFIGPLNEIVEEAKIKNNELREADLAQKDLAKAENKLSKLEQKPKEKIKPGQIEEAKAVVKAAEENYKNQEVEAKVATEKFNKSKLEKIKEVLKNLAEIEKLYHNKALTSMNSVKEKAEAIKVEEESKLL